MTKTNSEQRGSSTGRVVGRPFEKGRSGNPGGRVKLPAEVRERAMAYSVDALDALHAIATDNAQPSAARVSAAVAIIDRGYGKPTATVVASVGTLAELIEAARKLPVIP